MLKYWNILCTNALKDTSRPQIYRENTINLVKNAKLNHLSNLNILFEVVKKLKAMRWFGKPL